MRTTVIVSLVFLAVSAAGSTTAHSSRADTCFGLAPTVTGAPGARVVLGTEGDDVVIAADVEQVETFAGNDAICVAGSSRIDAGSGDDRVLSTAVTGGNLVVLGSGSDLFEGSSGDDEVWAEAVEDGRSSPGEEFANADTVRTDGGADLVHSGVWVHPNEDEIDLGSGPDTVHFSANSGLARLTGGTGRDLVATWLVRAPMPAVTYDLEAGLASFLVSGQEQAFAMLDGFEDVSVTVYTQTPVTVRGTSRSNRIFVQGSATVDAGGGSDDVVLRGDPDAVRGGPGRDRVTMAGYSDRINKRVLYDLRLRTFSRGNRTVPFETEVLNVRGVDRRREHVRVIGSSRRDVITVAACGAAVRGGPGRDRLRVDSGRCGQVRTTLRGGTGADLVVGGRGREVLLGGAGYDSAVGRRGFDRCRAEVEKGCESD